MVALVVGGKYLDRTGIVVDIVEKREPTNKKNIAYPFKDHNGDTYSPYGIFDLDESTSLDLIEHVNQDYIILHGADNQSYLINASDPKDAVRQFISTTADDQNFGEVNHVYKLEDVTPKEE